MWRGAPNPGAKPRGRAPTNRRSVKSQDEQVRWLSALGMLQLAWTQRLAFPSFSRSKALALNPVFCQILIFF